MRDVPAPDQALDLRARLLGDFAGEESVEPVSVMLGFGGHFDTRHGRQVQKVLMALMVLMVQKVSGELAGSASSNPQNPQNL